MSDWQETAKPWFWKNGMYNVQGMAEEIERLRAENSRLQSHHTALHSAATRTVEAWEWWQVDTFDRDQSVPDNAIDALMNVLHSLKPPLSSDSPSPHPAEKGSGT